MGHDLPFRFCRGPWAAKNKLPISIWLFPIRREALYCIFGQNPLFYKSGESKAGKKGEILARARVW
jgi:hypothetical protein